MRITGGIHRGRILKTPQHSGLRPASDKVRQAVFNMLLSYDLPNNARVLDLFCGTGSYGLEALSRGATYCKFIDKNPKALSLARQNLETLDLSNHSDVIKSDILKYNVILSDYDLIFLDPPYNENLVHEFFKTIKKPDNTGSETIFVIEAEKKFQTPDSLSVLKEKLYGQTKIIFAKL